MKRLTVIILLISLVMTLPAEANARPFSELYVSGPCGIDLVCSPDSAGIVLPQDETGSDCGLDIRRSDDALYVSVNPESVTTGRVQLRIYTGPSLRIISAEGRAAVTGAGLHSAGQMSLVSSGASSLDLSDLSAGNINVSLSGSGNVSLKGEIAAMTLNLSLTGSGKITVEGLAVSVLSQTFRGSGRMTVCGSAGKCSAVSSGTGTINVSKLVSADMDLKLFGNGRIFYPAGVRVRTEGKTSNIISVKPYQP